MPIDKREAEKLFGALIEVFDGLNALKERDEFLCFRRRMRLFAHQPEQPYRSHMEDTLNRLPAYAGWLKAAKCLGAAEATMQLRDLLEDMMKTKPKFSSCHDGAQG